MYLCMFDILILSKVKILNKKKFCREICLKHAFYKVNPSNLM